MPASKKYIMYSGSSKLPKTSRPLLAIHVSYKTQHTSIWVCNMNSTELQQEIRITKDRILKARLSFLNYYYKPGKSYTLLYVLLQRFKTVVTDSSIATVVHD